MLIFMGTITVVVEDGVEERFREKTMQKFGKKKGSLGKAVTQAMDNWAEQEDDNVVAETIKLLEKGINLGGITYKSRDELHER